MRIFKTLFALWERLSNLGVKPGTEANQAQRWRLTNRLAVVLTLLCLPYFTISEVGSTSFWIVFSVAGASALVLPLSALGFFTTARLMAILPYVLVLTVSSALTDPSPNYTLGARLCMVSAIIMPALLFSIREWLFFGLSGLILVTTAAQDELADGLRPWLRMVLPPIPPVEKLEETVRMLFVTTPIFTLAGLTFLSRSAEKERQRSQQLLLEAEERNRQMAESQEELTRQAEELADSQTSMVRMLDQRNHESALEERLSRIQLWLRWHGTESLETFANRFLQHLSIDLNALQASLYLAEQQDESPLRGEPGFRLVAAFARPKQLPERLVMGQGLAGQAARNRQAFFLAHSQLAPAAENHVAAGLVAVTPREVVVLPLLHDDQVQGLLELAFARPWPQADRTHLHKMGHLIAANLFAIRSQIHIKQLLEQSEDANLALMAQEEELRATVAELRRAQAQMNHYQTQLEDSNLQLEAKVRARTAELEHAMEEIKSTQNQLIFNEKMAVLGTLMAGVAHEMNTPLGAIKAAAINILDILPALVRNSSDLLPKLEDDICALAKEFISTILIESQFLTTREERALRRQYRDLLTQAGIADGDLIADKVIEAGFIRDLQPFLPLFTCARAPEVLEYINFQGQIIRNMRNINIAADKTKKVVYALKSYAHTSDGMERIMTDVVENVDVVLTIYHNQIKYGINLQTHFDEVPPIPAFPDELSQVWTNILQNAIQAMGGGGTLTIEVFKRDDHAEVRFTDSGPGIPAEVLPRIFEPFFTTKARGEGSGLGLDICKKIIEKHQGTIEVDTEPGRTTFIVKLPYTPA